MISVISQMNRYTCAASVLVFFYSAVAGQAKALSGEDEFAQAKQLIARGAFEESIPHWKDAAAQFEQAGNWNGKCEAEIQLAAALNVLGRTNLAIERLRVVEAAAAQKDDIKHVAAAKVALGSIYILSSPPTQMKMDHGAMSEDDAQANLKEGLKLARSVKDLYLEAVALNNLANLHSYQKQFEVAKEEYQSAQSIAETSHDKDLSSQLSANLAYACIQAGDYEEAEDAADEAISIASKSTDSHSKVYNLLAGGRTLTELFKATGDNDLRLRAFKTFQQAGSCAERIADKRGLSYALGYQGELYEQEKKDDAALALTRQAMLIAQALKSPDMTYRWEWQTGRLLRAKQDREGAILAYRRAIQIVQTIRHDMALRYGNPNAHSSFREVAGPIYTQLADLILQRIASDEDQASLREARDLKIASSNEGQASLREARDVIESLRSAELEDYFQDQCVNLLKSKITSIEQISATSAVVYIIPLPDRTELLVSLRSGIKRVKSPVTDEALADVAHAFRTNLEKRTTYEYLDQAKQLYDWLIKPLTPLLASNQIDTLVFIPDGALRNIPMAALYDGEKYLVEKYAVAVTPGLTLMEPTPLKKEKIELVVNGLSDGVQGFAPLQYVPGEMSNLKKLFGGAELINREFTKPNVDKEFAQQNYSIVHIASHGHFDSDARKTFVLTFDSRLTLDNLEQLLRPSQLREKPVELLALSACQTAAGDDRAALGLAGVAIKAGARCAFATLWFVNDQSSAMLVSDFYTQLRDHPDISKAKALQAAQVKLLADERYAHPCYWAPFLIIGNWL
jgi:CHAT domain-containing protein